MKRKITALVLALGMLLGTVSIGSAVEVKIGGQFDFGFFLQDKIGRFDGTFAEYKDGGNSHEFVARQRVRTWFDFIMSESLKGQLVLEIGETNWGNVGENTAAGSGFSLNGDGVSIEVRRAFIDWIVPNTTLQVRMGLQDFVMPMALGKNVAFDDQMAGIMLSYKFNDMFAANLFWARPYDGTVNDAYTNERSGEDEMDVFGLIIPITGTGWSVSPWGAYANIGNDLGDMVTHPGQNRQVDANGNIIYGQPYYHGRDLRITNGGKGYDYAWWAGVAVNVTALDPFEIKFDAIYGMLHNDDNDDDFGTRGFWIGGALDYKADWATPGLFAWYASGDDDDKRRQMAMFSSPGSSLLATGFDGGEIDLTGDGGGAKVLHKAGIGTWGVGLQVKDISFIDKLTHVVRVAYIQGTNDKDSPYNDYTGVGGERFSAWYMSTKDWAINIEFNTTYLIYDNLIANFELGYVIPDFDDHGQNLDNRYDENAFRAALGLTYKF